MIPKPKSYVNVLYLNLQSINILSSNICTAKIQNAYAYVWSHMKFILFLRSSILLHMYIREFIIKKQCMQQFIHAIPKISFWFPWHLTFNIIMLVSIIQFDLNCYFDAVLYIIYTLIEFVLPLLLFCLNIYIYIYTKLYITKLNLLYNITDQ